MTALSFKKGDDDFDSDVVERIASKISQGLEPVTTVELSALSKAAFGWPSTTSTAENSAPSTSDECNDWSASLPFLNRHYLKQEHVERHGHVTLVRYLGMVQDVSVYLCGLPFLLSILILLYLNLCVFRFSDAGR